MDDRYKIISYDGRYDDILGVKFPKLDIVRGKGVEKHILKNHPGCIKYISKIEEIIDLPDYVGINPKESKSFELVKKYDDNVLVAVKLDVKNDYYYIASIYDITQAKIDSRLYSGRLKKYIKK